MSLPILLIPGLSCTAEIWARQIPQLWSRGPVTVANHTGGTTMAEIATGILATAPPVFALGGISMGGYIAFEIWRQAPERVKGLALVDTSARADTPDATKRRRSAMAVTRAGRFEQIVALAFPITVHPDHVGDPTLLSLHTRMALAVGADTYVHHQDAIITRPDSRPDLQNITVPTLVIVGDADQLTPPEFAREMASGLPNATLSVVPDAGHMALAEQPDATNAALLAWLDRL